MNELTHLSLFSGIGGLDLAAEGAGFRTVGQCEWADYPRAVLEKHWPGLPRWRDIRTLTKESFYEQTGLETVTVLSGGFPCQPFSTAGKRRGKEDDRYLWPEMLRVISEIRPTWVVGENVAGIVSMALDTVLSDLEGIGYTCQAVIIPACAVDAPHRRDRCAILAHTNNSQTPRQRKHGGEIHAGSESEGSDLCRCNVSHAESKRCREARECITGCTERTARVCEDVANADVGTVWNDSNHKWTTDREVYQTIYPSIPGGTEKSDTNTNCQLRTNTMPAWRGRTGLGNICESVSDPDSYRLEKSWMQGLSEKQTRTATNIGWWPTEPPVGRVAHGIPKRVDRLRCLGNAVVPQQFYPIFQAIAYVEEVLKNE